MKNEIEIWFESKLRQGVSKEELIKALKQNNYTDSQIQRTVENVDSYLNAFNDDKIEDGKIINYKLQVQAELINWYQEKLKKGYDKDVLISELHKQGYDEEIIEIVEKNSI